MGGKEGEEGKEDTGVGVHGDMDFFLEVKNTGGVLVWS